MSSSNQLPRTWTMLRPVEPEVLQRMLLYQSKTAFYLLGYYGDESSCRLLTFPKQSPKSSKQLAVVEDSNIHTPQQAEAMFCDIHSDPDEGLEFLCEVFPLSFFPFLTQFLGIWCLGLLSFVGGLLSLSDY